MGNWGMKSSKPSIDVRDAEDKELIFSTKFNSLKIAIEGSTTLTVNNGATNTKVIAHGLPNTPSHMVFVKELNYGGNDFWVSDGGGAYQLPIYDPSTATTNNTLLGDQSNFSAWTDGTNLNVEIRNFSGAQKTYEIYYYVLIEDNA